MPFAHGLYELDGLVFSPCGERLAAVWNNIILLIDADEGKVVFQKPFAPLHFDARTVAFSSDGSYARTGAFSSDGSYLAVGGCMAVVQRGFVVF